LTNAENKQATSNLIRALTKLGCRVSEKKDSTADRKATCWSLHPGSQLKEARIFDPLDWDQNSQARVYLGSWGAKKRSFAAASKSSRALQSELRKKNIFVSAFRYIFDLSLGILC
jgi:hypothetical protein